MPQSARETDVSRSALVRPAGYVPARSEINFVFLEQLRRMFWWWGLKLYRFSIGAEYGGGLDSVAYGE